ncbi:hypothetical protein BZG35_04775 [Brevundimonas sp. LM2]|uniref:hypothetical protein n=1 Tax=Brevundimonas sp. LM2 TaxID=1938605 RepID=UPI000983D976|nr:hypothetical protein [Brevundimonas sp. LM2]AQR61051.1 hypothetical protein BZG35_04775 [Brevundimonas sp. LM2]
MRFRLSLPVLAVFTIATTACAPVDAGRVASSGAASPAARQCFSQSQVTNFRQGQDERIYLRVLNRDVFELQSFGGCDLERANAIQIGPEQGGSSRLCIGDRVRIPNDGSDLVNVACRARITRMLTPAEVEALPSRDRP